MLRVLEKSILMYWFNEQNCVGSCTFSRLVEVGVTLNVVLNELLVSLQVHMATGESQHTGRTLRSPDPLPVLIYITVG